jgi:hypothetical protein
MPRAGTQSPGKTSFVKEFLHNHPEGNTAAVNEAWKAEGMKGGISSTLVNKTRSALGLSGNLRRKRSAKDGAASDKPAYTGKKRGRKPKNAAVSASAVSKTDGARVKPGQLAELEADLDMLLFKVMRLGGFTEIENSLRETRRLLYGGFATRR